MRLPVRQRVPTTQTPSTDPGPAWRVVPGRQARASVGLYGTSSPSLTSWSLHGPGGPALGGTCPSSPPATAGAGAASASDTRTSDAATDRIVDPTVRPPTGPPDRPGFSVDTGNLDPAQGSRRSPA